MTSRMGPLNAAEVVRLFQIAGDLASPSRCAVLWKSIRAHVKPGMILHFGYSEGRPMAISNALVRCFHGQSAGFTIVGSGFVSNQAALVATGLVRRIEASFVGENFPTPSPNRILQRAINRGEVEIENQSLLALYQRLAAGALGVPFYPTRSWAGSSLAKNSSYARVMDPFGDGEVGVVRALIPDISFVHGLAADHQGNILLSPPFGEAEIAAFASRLGVIATVEEIVSNREVSRHATLLKIPAHRVISVSKATFGSHPYGIFSPEGIDVPAYVEDHAFFLELREASRDDADFLDWTRKWILGTEHHDGYVRRLGSSRIENLRARASKDAWETDLDPDWLSRVSHTDVWDPTEMMVVAAATMLREKVLEKAYGIIEAGVGYANLAAWLAAQQLQTADAVCVELVAEIGLYGCSPRPGEPFIFSHRNLPTAKGLSGVEAILGLYVSGRHNNCIAIIGAGQIDSAGNINSTYAADGRFLVGSGGANDITSGATEVIAVTRQSRDRLVATLPYVTSSGRQVSTLVTDLGVFEKRDGQLALTRFFAAPGADTGDVLSNIKNMCGWDLQIDPALKRAEPPTGDELVRLRLFDSRNDFFPPPANEDGEHVQ